MHIQIGDSTYTLVSTRRGDQWTAHAVRAENGDRYGIEVTAASESDATSRLTRWLEWQHEHTAALDVLQQAEKAYHRAVGNAAFSSADTQVAEARPARIVMDEARHALDDVRARRPNV
jgi:hypothetical protein